MQVTGIGIQQGRLTGNCLYHLCMGMSDVADIVEAIEISTAPVIDQPGTFSTHELDRLGIGDREVWQQYFFALFDDFSAGSAILSKGFWRNASQIRNIRK